MDKKNVQKSICRNLFAQKRAALGNLRNFFGDHFARPYMVRGHAPTLNPVCGGQCQKGGFPGAACPFLGVSYFRKKGFGVLGTVFGAMGAGACPFLGVSYFRKKGFGVLGTVFGAMGAGACPFLRGSCFRKTRLADFRGSINRSRTRRRVRRFHRNQNRSTNGDTFGGWFFAIGRCRVRFQTQYPCKERISLKIVRLFLRMTVLR